MAIVPINNITLYGSIDQKQAVLEGLQRLGCAHLINLTPATGDGKPGRGYSTEAQEALQYLSTCPDRHQQAENPLGFDFATVEHEALTIRQRHDELLGERDSLAKAIDAVKP